MTFEKTLDHQKAYFQEGNTRPIKLRKLQLEKLLVLLQSNEDKLYKAIAKDLMKSEIETYSTELSFIYSEINYFIKHLSALTKPQKVSTNIVNQISSSKIYSEPFGNTLVIGAWNYPYQLSLVPAVSAIAAGNTVLLKPSEVALHTAEVMEKLINNNFDQGLFHVALGGVEETTEILKLSFDKIFFTGSPQVGKIVYLAAAKHLTPVTLELGGKSPAIVTPSANIDVAARRIVWGKFLNAGQTCLAPDYIYVHESVEKNLLEALKSYIQKFQYKEGAESYAKIINSKNFKRLKDLINPHKLFYGGETNEKTLHIQPTILTEIDWRDAVMHEEIFGPILPVLTYSNYDEMLQRIGTHEKPLSAYLFSTKYAEKKKFTQELSFGGGCINDTVMHFSNPNLPFGGVGNSGIGHYHGKYGFETFSHKKSVMDKTIWGEPDLKYPPYNASKRKWIKRLL